MKFSPFGKNKDNDCKHEWMISDQRNVGSPKEKLVKTCTKCGEQDIIPLGSRAKKRHKTLRGRFGVSLKYLYVILDRVFLPLTPKTTILVGILGMILAGALVIPIFYFSTGKFFGTNNLVLNAGWGLLTFVVWLGFVDIIMIILHKVKREVNL